MKLVHISKTDVGLVRPANEDSIGSIIDHNGIYSNIYIVCDGMGGHVGGSRASQTAIRSILEYFNNTPSQNPNTALKDAIDFANMQIFGDAQANPEFKGMGTTVTLMVESDGLIYIAHVGDSRIYINTDRELFRITKDHSFVQNLVDAGQLTDAEMETHPRKNELTKALGIAIDVDVEVAPNPVRAKIGDKFLLCSDGLCGLVNDATISSTVNAYSDLEATVDELIKLANNAGGHDNISVDLIEVIESDFIKTSFIDKNNVSNSITGTQEVKLEPTLVRPKINKKLILLGSSFLMLSIILMFLTFDSSDLDTEIPKISKKEAVIDSTNVNDQDLGKIFQSLAKDKNSNDTMFYAFTTNITSKLFTDAINKSGLFKELTKSNKAREKQKYFLADVNMIKSVIEIRELFKDPADKMAEGSFIFILKSDLELIKQDVSNSSLISESIDVVKEKLNQHKKSIEKEKKIINFVGYLVETLSHSENCTTAVKKGTCKVEFQIRHKETKQQTKGSYKHKFKISSVFENKFNELKTKLKDRKSYNLLSEEDKKYVEIEPITSPICESQEIDVKYTISVGSQLHEDKFEETIPANKKICYEEEIENLKKNYRLGALAYDTDNKIDIITKTDSRDNVWFSNRNILYEGVYIFDLEDKYLKENDIKQKYINEGYVEQKPSQDSKVVWFFTTQINQQTRRSEENNPFNRKDFKLLEKCLDDFKKDIKLYIKTK